MNTPYTALCTECGKPERKRWQGKLPKLCRECALIRARDAALQMRRRSGPYYARWLASRGPAGRPRKNASGRNAQSVPIADQAQVMPNDTTDTRQVNTAA